MIMPANWHYVVATFLLQLLWQISFWRSAFLRLVSGTCKFDRGLSSLLHNDLHWLHVPECINYKLNVTVHRCLQKKAGASRYLSTVEHQFPAVEDYAQPVDTTLLSHRVTGWARSGAFGLFRSPVLLRWTLPDCLRDPTLSSGRFRRKPLKTQTYLRVIKHTKRRRDASWLCTV